MVSCRDVHHLMNMERMRETIHQPFLVPATKYNVRCTQNTMCSLHQIQCQQVNKYDLHCTPNTIDWWTNTIHRCHQKVFVDQMHPAADSCNPSCKVEKIGNLQKKIQTLRISSYACPVHTVFVALKLLDFQNCNKVASLEATLVQNSDPVTQQVTDQCKV